MNSYHIYAVVNTFTRDAYVGCTSRLQRRIHDHLHFLAAGIHPSRKFQDAWNRYGGDAFQFAVLENLGPIGREAAAAIEAIWIGKLGTYNEMIGNRWSEAMRENSKRWADPERRSEHSQRIEAVWADPERQQAYANRSTRWDNPKESAKHSEHMKAVWADPERRRKLEARRAARWADPEAKARQSEKMRAYHEKRRAVLAGRFKVSDEDHTGS